jgi:GH15 family glucan-1,4-alpha-glucosidase
MINRIIRKLMLWKLKRMQYRTGVFGAAKLDVSTGYNKAWIRDNVYVALGLEKAQDIDAAKRVLQGIFDVLRKHEYKIDWAIKEKPDARYKYIHARFCPMTFDEFHDDWGNKQNDAVGAFLFEVGMLFNKGIMVVRDENDLRVLQKLVYYLESIEYWHDPDNGVWENDEMLHASSIGACVAGLAAVRCMVDVPESLVKIGEEALNQLLPKESESRDVDLALLSLIYPYAVVTNEQRDMILEAVENRLVRERGVIRYLGDMYYNNGAEAEWVMGFPWLAIIYRQMGDQRKYDAYMRKTYQAMTWTGDLPELYLGKTSTYNENTPLSWNHALLLCAISPS